jgi:hypothetical protein
LDTKKNRQRVKYDRLTQLEGRVEYLEGVIYKLFELTEQLLTRLEKIKEKETKQSQGTGRAMPIIAFFAYS